MSDDKIQKVKIVKSGLREFITLILIVWLIILIWAWISLDHVEYTGKVEVMRDNDFRIIIYVEEVQRKFVVKVNPNIFVNDIQVGDIVHINGLKRDDAVYYFMELTKNFKGKKNEN